MIKKPLTPEMFPITYCGIEIRYVDKNTSAEGRNFDTYVEVYPNFFDFDYDTQIDILQHEVCHTLAEILYKNIPNLFVEIMYDTDFGERKKFKDRVYWEGIFGDVGANSVDETFTDCLKYYIRNKKWLESKHPNVVFKLEKWLKQSNVDVNEYTI